MVSAGLEYVQKMRWIVAISFLLNTRNDPFSIKDRQEGRG